MDISIGVEDVLRTRKRMRPLEPCLDFQNVFTYSNTYGVFANQRSQMSHTYDTSSLKLSHMVLIDCQNPNPHEGVLLLLRWRLWDMRMYDHLVICSPLWRKVAISPKTHAAGPPVPMRVGTPF